MTTVLVCMALGMVLGLKWFPERWQKWNSRVQFALIAVLIFCMGASLGGNPDFFGNLAEVGLKAVLFAVIPVVFSVAAVYLATKNLMKGKKPE